MIQLFNRDAPGREIWLVGIKRLIVIPGVGPGSQTRLADLHLQAVILGRTIRMGGGEGRRIEAWPPLNTVIKLTDQVITRPQHTPPALHGENLPIQILDACLLSRSEEHTSELQS